MTPSTSSISGRLGAVLAAGIALVLSRAPGWSDEAWSRHQHPLPEDGVGGAFVFRGGRDGQTPLAGRIALPPPSSSSESSESEPPVVVLAHGLGLSADCSLAPFVSALNAAGFAAATFDYATFGASSNGAMPRHSVDPPTHISDFLAATRAVKSRAKEFGVDGDRIALWGTSLGGGHAIAAAAALSDDDDSYEALRRSVKAVATLVPHLAAGAEGVLERVLSDPSTFLVGVGKIQTALLKGAFLGLTIGKSWYLPLHGPPGSAAVMQNPGDDEGYGLMCDSDGGQYGRRNGLTAASVPRLLAYRPLSVASKVQGVPVQMIMAENDTLCPAHRAGEAAALMGEGQAEVMVLPGLRHFDVYSGGSLAAVLEAQVAFLKKNLR